MPVEERQLVGISNHPDARDRAVLEAQREHAVELTTGDKGGFALIWATCPDTHVIHQLTALPNEGRAARAIWRTPIGSAS